MNTSANTLPISKSLNPTPPISHGAYYGGVLGPGFEITFDGSGSHDTDIDNLGQTPKWRWDFDYNGSFSANKTTTSALTTWEYSQPGAYTVAVRYVDNDNQTGQTYTFQINVTNPRRYYYIKDHLGSIRTTVDEDGNVSGYDDYYPFGLTMPGRSSNTGNPNDDYKFTGYELDDEADLTLYHANARGYDPVLGRFLSVDPLAEVFPTWSPYSYVFNNPLSYTDPTGMSPVCEENQNCDETYKKGTVVENRLGSWRYLGDNQWETLSLADNVEELTNTFEFISDWLTNGVVNTYYDFGERTLAENSLNVSTTSSLDNPVTWLVGGGLAFAGKIPKAFNGSSYLWKVGSYKNLRGLEAGLDAHHVGQRALMKKFVPGYNSRTAPSILVPRAGHTRGTGVVSRNTTVGLTNARQVLARDIFELRRVYGVRGIPNSSLKQLIQMNKKMYPEAFIKKN